MTSQDGQDSDKLAEIRHPHLHHVAEVPRRAHRVTVKLCRRHKTMIHGVIFAALVITMYVDGFKPLDALFFILSAVTEVN